MSDFHQLQNIECRKTAEKALKSTWSRFIEGVGFEAYGSGLSLNSPNPSTKSPVRHDSQAIA